MNDSYGTMVLKAHTILSFMKAQDTLQHTTTHSQNKKRIYHFACPA